MELAPLHFLLNERQALSTTVQDHRSIPPQDLLRIQKSSMATPTWEVLAPSTCVDAGFLRELITRPWLKPS